MTTALKRLGFTPVHRKGSHETWVRTVHGKNRTTVVVLGEHDVDKATLRGILKLGGISEAEFLAALRKRSERQA